MFVLDTILHSTNECLNVISANYKIEFSFIPGNSTYCWISDKTAIAVSMVTPVSLALVFNITCLVNNLYAIRHLQQVRDISELAFLVLKWGTDRTPKQVELARR